jgi:hypothetical protein
MIIRLLIFDGFIKEKEKRRKGEEEIVFWLIILKALI